MHAEAMAWIAEHATDAPVEVLDIGGRDVGGDWGGSPRSHFPAASVYHVLDITEGPDVDIVADASTWQPNGRRYDVVISVECFEHTGAWPAICRTAYAACKPGGLFIATMAGPGRRPHGAHGAHDLALGEHYANVRPERLRTVLERAGFTGVVVDQQDDPADVRAVATKPKGGRVG
jgi:SAM-dependent methyltransferase